MLTPYELFVGLRYTRAKRRNHFISFISITSMLGVALGVAALIVVLSVMNGFQKELRTRILGVASHVQIMGLDGKLSDWRKIAAEAQSHPEVAAADERNPDEPRPLGPHAKRDRPAGQSARERRRVVDLQPGLRDPAAVAQGVRHPHPVADVTVELAHRVAGLEVGQSEPDEDVRPADDQDAEIEQVEVEQVARREGGDDQHGGEDQRLQPSKHSRSPSPLAWPSRR
jgi:hypothetical protein